MSLAGDLGEANRRYEQALAIASDPQTRSRIERKQHRPRTAVRDGARIAFYEHGSGPETLLFVAPLAYGLATFQPIVERLCQEFRVVTINSRGTGASDPLVRPYPLSEHVKDVRTVIDALGGGPVIGVGLSRGGNLLLKLAHTEPRLFAKLVTIGCSPGPPGQRVLLRGVPAAASTSRRQGRPRADRQVPHLARVLRAGDARAAGTLRPHKGWSSQARRC